MKVVFENINIKNFMSYETASLSFDKKGFTVVSGINNNPIDGAKSNGTGKSSLFSAISWALTGLTVGGGKEVANIYLKGTTSVELDFSIDDISYKIIRTKNPSNLQLFVSGENKSGKGIRDTEKILHEYLPDITHNLINSVIILGQGLPQKFTSNTPSGRKEVLEKLANSDFMISDLKTRVASRGVYLKSEIRKNEDGITDLTARTSILKDRQKTLENSLINYSDGRLYHLTEKLKEIEDSLALTTFEQSMMTASIQKVQTEVDTLNDVLISRATEHEQKKAKLPLKDTSKFIENIASVKATITALASEIQKLDSITDTCPTCGQKLPDVHKIDTTDKKNELANLRVDLDKLIQEKSDADKFNTDVLEKYQNDFVESNRQDEQKKVNLTSQLNKYQAQLQDILDTISQTQRTQDKLSLEIEQFEKNKQSVLTELGQIKTDIEHYNSKILYYNNNVETLKSHLEVNSKMSTILSRDFRGYLLADVIQFISEQAKQYALQLFGTDKLNFELDGNNISITYDGKDYEVLSGGEKQKVDVIVQFSIRNMLCQYLNFSSNILVLDEITDNLDIVGSQKMFDLISTKLNDVESVYIISHHQNDFEIPYDHEINIVKGLDKISRIVLA